MRRKTARKYAVFVLIILIILLHLRCTRSIAFYLTRMLPLVLMEIQMMKRKACYAFVFLIILTFTCQAQTGHLKACRRRLISPTLTLPPIQKRPLTGSVLKEGKNEYRLKVTSKLTVEVKLKTTSQLSLEIYSLRPPTKIGSKMAGQPFTRELQTTNEYALVVNNCYGSSNGTYTLEITIIQ